MPVPKTSELKTVSLVLTQEQVRRLRARQVMQSSTLRPISFSDVGREVVEEGLKALSHGRDSILTASVEKETEAA